VSLSFPFDPAERAEEVERLVIRNGRRLYYRFRGASYYGGIATADAIGCSFLCAYCWNYFRNLNPARFNKFYSAQQVAANLLKIARERSFHLFRMTGSEPLLGEASLEHLTGVLEIIFQERPHSVFILETNGFFLGWRTDLIKRLEFKNLWIRISVKGVDEESFELISGAKKRFFRYPLLALKELEKAGMKVWPAVMRDLFSDEEVGRLERILEEYGISARLEEEMLEEYPFVTENMKKRKVQIRHL
jgi:uncharacterized Fe-S cluster-containing radical SAM superfamily protein